MRETIIPRKKIYQAKNTDRPVDLPAAASAALIHHQGIICGVAFAYSSPGLRRGRLAGIASYASVVAPRRLASDAFLVIRDVAEPTASTNEI
jgi:hypothetical protein